MILIKTILYIGLFPIIICFLAQFVYIRYIDEDSGVCKVIEDKGNIKLVGKCNYLVNDILRNTKKE